MMKKLLKSVIRTIPEMLSVLLLLAFHLYFFTMIGMLVLKEQENPSDESTVPRPPFPEDGDAIYFARLGDAIISLLVLLTTGRFKIRVRSQNEDFRNHKILRNFIYVISKFFHSE